MNSWKDILKAPVWDVELPKGKYFTLSINEKIDRSKSYSKHGMMGAAGKPKGLWFSFTDKRNWIDWLKHNEPMWEYHYEYLITFDISGNILRIKDRKDMEKLMEEYLIPVSSVGGRTSTLDWNRLSKEYDAAIFEYHGVGWQGEWDEKGLPTPMHNQMWLDSLDVGSGVVWNLDSITDEKVYAHRKLKRGHRRTKARNVPYGKEKEAVTIAGRAHGDWVIE